MVETLKPETSHFETFDCELWKKMRFGQVISPLLR
jgi:hypothetical protein